MIFAQISRNIHKSCFLRKCLGIITRKSIDFQVTIPGNKLISGYCYSEINLFLGNNTRKSIDFRVSCPRNRYKKTLFREYLRENENIFENILACESRDQVLLIHEKTRCKKSHATVPLIDVQQIYLPKKSLSPK